MNKINDVIQNIEQRGFRFRATRDWYKAIGSNPKEFAMFRENRKDPSYIQLKKIAEMFMVEMEDLISDEDLK
ncbi:hypothetical protein [Algivirga pacifica]|uniref:Transcriptional regulator n=1 Tax=Algivirga pacifica TaxID=1162670 RepID=A0ABP9DF00_9BACT